MVISANIFAVSIAIFLEFSWKFNNKSGISAENSGRINQYGEKLILCNQLAISFTLPPELYCKYVAI